MDKNLYSTFIFLQQNQQKQKQHFHSKMWLLFLFIYLFIQQQLVNDKSLAGTVLDAGIKLLIKSDKAPDFVKFIY